MKAFPRFLAFSFFASLGLALPLHLALADPEWPINYWVEVSHETKEANTPKEINALISQYSDSYQYSRDEVANQLLAGLTPRYMTRLTVTTYHYHYTGPTICAANDPRLESYSTEKSITWSDHHSEATASASSGEDPCASTDPSKSNPKGISK